MSALSPINSNYTQTLDSSRSSYLNSPTNDDISESPEFNMHEEDHKTEQELNVVPPIDDILVIDSTPGIDMNKKKPSVIRFNTYERDSMKPFADQRQKINEELTPPIQIQRSDNTINNDILNTINMLDTLQQKSEYFYQKVGLWLLAKCGSKNLMSSENRCKIRAAKVAGIMISVVTVFGALHDVIRISYNKLKECYEKKDQTHIPHPFSK
jgi:hypothetical protein